MRFVLILFGFALALNGMAQETKAQGDHLYEAGEYGKAIAVYEKVLKQGYHADVYYNLGNAYYRTNDIGRAVLNYERAYLLAPEKDDIRYNLSFVRSKIKNNSSVSTSFIKDWTHSVAYWVGTRQWGWIAVGCLVIALFSFLLYFFDARLWVRKSSFYVLLISVLGFVLGNVCREYQTYCISHRDNAIVLKATEAKEHFQTTEEKDILLSVGIKVKMKKNRIRQWQEIVLPDGRDVWVKSNAVELI